MGLGNRGVERHLVMVSGNIVVEMSSHEIINDPDAPTVPARCVILRNVQFVETWKTRIIGKQGRFRWWWLWLAVAGLAVVVSPLGAQDGIDCRFSDVPQSSPQQADIFYACQQGWFEGYPDDTFRPDREVHQRQIAAVVSRAFPAGSTRADLATFLRGGNPGAPDGSADFDDVAESHPQNRDIAYAVQQGWFEGYPDDTFRPDRTITPNQIATVVGRAFPASSTRADLATFMRQGSQALNALTPPTTSSSRKIAYTVPKYDSSGIRKPWSCGYLEPMVRMLAG